MKGTSAPYSRATAAISSSSVDTITRSIHLLSKDTSIEAPGSAWRDFKLIQGHTKAFFDLKGADHSEPVEAHRGGPFIAKWSQLFALGDESAAPVFYSNGADSISSILPVSGAGDANTGDQKVGYVACREDEAGSIVSEPSDFRNYC